MQPYLTGNAAEPVDTGCGWILFDGACPLCKGTIRRWKPTLHRRGFRFAALQEEWVRMRLGLAQGELPAEMKLLLPDGRTVGGLDALIHLARSVWWLSLLGWMAGLPGIHALSAAVYRWIAARRYCVAGVCPIWNNRERRPHHSATTFLELP